MEIINMVQWFFTLNYKYGNSKCLLYKLYILKVLCSNIWYKISQSSPENLEIAVRMHLDNKAMDGEYNYNQLLAYSPINNYA
jgi:hypothetical protein